LTLFSLFLVTATLRKCTRPQWHRREKKRRHLRISPSNSLTSIVKSATVDVATRCRSIRHLEPDLRREPPIPNTMINWFSSAVSIDETNKLGDGQFNRTTEPDGPAQECVQPLRGQCGPYGPVLIATPSSPTEGAREFDQHPWMRPDGQQ